MHTESETFIWTMECMTRFHVIFAIDCCQLVKMVNQKNDLLLHTQCLQRHFSYLEIKHISRPQNIMADRLAWDVRSQPSIYVHMDTKFFFLVSSVFIECLCRLFMSMTKKPDNIQKSKKVIIIVLQYNNLIYWMQHLYSSFIRIAGFYFSFW